MKAYDPLQPPDPAVWQSLDEQERIALVTAYHRRAGVKLPSGLGHATIHVIVENQVALGEETPVRATLDRLQREGLDRHDAIHAIGSVLADHLQALLKGPSRDTDPDAAYYERLGALTPESWRQEFG